MRQRSETATCPLERPRNSAEADLIYAVTRAVCRKANRGLPAAVIKSKYSMNLMFHGGILVEYPVSQFATSSRYSRDARSRKYTVDYDRAHYALITITQFFSRHSRLIVLDT